MNEHFKGLGHIAVHTKDLAGSIAFYEKIGGTLHQRDAIPTPDGDKLLALVEFGGFVLELIQSPTPIQGIAPGQFGVLYTADGRICAGSGEICGGI